MLLALLVVWGMFMLAFSAFRLYFEQNAQGLIWHFFNPLTIRFDCGAVSIWSTQDSGGEL